VSDTPDDGYPAADFTPQDLLDDFAVPPSPSGEPPTVSDTRTLCAVCGIWQCLARHGGGFCHAVNGPADTSCGACYANRPTIKPDLTVGVASLLPEEPPTADPFWATIKPGDVLPDTRCRELEGNLSEFGETPDFHQTIALLISHHSLRQQFDAAESERSRLAGENAALRKDAERITRLEALGDFRVSEPRNSADAWEIRRDELSAGDLLRSVTIGYGADLRDAIDDTAARLPADPGGRE
jgi:hypothetical protein